MSNCIHQRVIEIKTNKQKTIYNKHQNTVDMQDYRAVTRVCMCSHVAIYRKHTHRTCMETVVDGPLITTILCYPRDAMLAWVLAISPCLSVCLSQVGVLWKGLNEPSWCLTCTAQRRATRVVGVNGRCLFVSSACGLGVTGGVQNEAEV